MPLENVRIGNTIVAGGSGPPGTENCAGELLAPPVSLGFNIDSLDQCGFKAPGDRVNTDPLLGPLAANGGPTETMAPALGSPAIDQGAAFGLSADQRGVVRPIDFPTIPNPAIAGRRRLRHRRLRATAVKRPDTGQAGAQQAAGHRRC